MTDRIDRATELRSAVLRRLEFLTGFLGAHDGHLENCSCPQAKKDVADILAGLDATVYHAETLANAVYMRESRDFINDRLKEFNAAWFALQDKRGA
jgi:hypothetical protein